MRALGWRKRRRYTRHQCAVRFKAACYHKRGQPCLSRKEKSTQVSVLYLLKEASRTFFNGFDGPTAYTGVVRVKREEFFFLYDLVEEVTLWRCCGLQEIRELVTTTPPGQFLWIYWTTFEPLLVHSSSPGFLSLPFMSLLHSLVVVSREWKGASTSKSSLGNKGIRLYVFGKGGIDITRWRVLC